jgi:hypothetical protein
MNLELISMVGGSLLGFTFRLINSLQESQAKALELSLRKTKSADASHDGAATRGSVWMRRLLIGAIIFGTILGPFILGLFELPVWVRDEPAGWDFLGVFTGGWTELTGFVVLPEVRAGLLGAIGYLLGSAAVGRR